LQWLKPIILAIWDVEIRRILIRGQSKQKAQETPSQLMNGWARWYVLIIPDMQGNTNRRIEVQAGSGKNMRPYLRNNQLQKGLGAWLKW
jgi:hypothetical protein